MEPWAVKFAKMFKERNNRPPVEGATAIVIDPLPDIRLSLTDDVILFREHLVIASRIMEIDLRSGDQVVVLPTASGQRFYLLDKVV